MTTSIHKKKTDNRFSVSLVYVISLFVLMASGSTATTIVYASHDSSSSNNTGSTSSTPSTSGSSASGPSSSSSSSGGSSRAHCDRPGYPSCASLGSKAGASAPGSSCPPGHSKAFCSAYNSAAGSSANTLPGSSTQGSTAHCDAPGYPSCYSLGYANGKNHPGTSCPSGHSQNYCNGYRAGAGSSASSNNTTGLSFQADIAHCDQKGWPSCYSVGFQDGKVHPGAACPSGHSTDFCSGWNAGAGNTTHCDQKGWPTCYSMGYSDGLHHIGAICPSGHSANYCSGWNAGAGIATHCDQPGWPSCYDVGYQAGKNAAPGTSCPSGHSQAFCTGYEAGVGATALLVAHCDQPHYPSCYNLGFQAGKIAAPGTSCPSGHTLNYCSGWVAGNTGTGLTTKCTISVNHASFTTEQNKSTDIKLTEQDTGQCAKPITISIVSQPAHGNLKSTGTADQYTYTPNTGFSGPDNFQYQASDNNGTKSNLGTISITVGSLPTPYTKLLVSIEVAKNPIVRGNNQTITVTVTDNTGKKVAGTDVQGEVLYVSGYVHKLSGITDNLGQLIHSWRISGDADTGQFKVTVVATATGYEKGSATSTFTVTPKPAA